MKSSDFPVEGTRSTLQRRRFLELTLAAGGLLTLRTTTGITRNIAQSAHSMAPSSSAKNPRPFYVIGHDTNSIELVERHLELGANAIEIDVDVTEGNQQRLCVCHGPKLVTGPASPSSPELEDFLDAVRRISWKFPQLCLIYFDCKPLTATPQHLETILRAIKESLLDAPQSPTGLTTVISVALLKERNMFAHSAQLLAPTEGLMIDYDNDPRAVAAYFLRQGITREGYANGISFANPMSWLFAPHVKSSVQRACALRDAEDAPKWVFSWTVNELASMKRYIQFGVDGLITDANPPWYNPGSGLRGLMRLIATDGPRLGIRLATRTDNPLRRPVHAV